jgi:hypothetical protein
MLREAPYRLSSTPVTAHRVTVEVQSAGQGGVRQWLIIRTVSFMVSS